MSLSPPVRQAVEGVVGAVRRTAPVGGGCIAHATRVETKRGPFFLKWAEGPAGRTFAKEAEGLRVLRAAAGPDLLVPEPLLVRDAADGEPGFFLAEWVERGRADRAYWARFGVAFAALHRAKAPVRGEAGPYGFPTDNVIGRLPQPNGWRGNWPSFFREHRLEPRFALARAQGCWDAAWDALADRLLDRLSDLLPAHPTPSLLHGDLWSGNAFPSADGRAVLIDPAVYVGDREADLAMTELFGGFEAPFYDAYRAAWPLEPGYEERREVYNLYHLVNHLTHFGGGYASGVARVLRRFGG
ncbi:MAG TPA: fructosamine kinase family protein [Rubricoccaceae bacterium]|nr:fructosamine kinase family protein [Rubricoccaceae bacterium]